MTPRASFTWPFSEVWGIRKGPHHLFPGKKLPENAADVFPDLKRGDLGSCALVAVADSMLGKKRGPEIDAHDTVFRYNGPIKVRFDILHVSYR